MLISKYLILNEYIYHYNNHYILLIISSASNCFLYKTLNKFKLISEIISLIYFKISAFL